MGLAPIVPRPEIINAGGQGGLEVPQRTMVISSSKIPFSHHEVIQPASSQQLVSTLCILCSSFHLPSCFSKLRAKFVNAAKIRHQIFGNCQKINAACDPFRVSQPFIAEFKINASEEHQDLHDGRQ